MMKKKSAKFLSFTTVSLLLHFLFFGGLIVLENSLFFAELNKLLSHTVEDKTKDVVTQIELIDLDENMMQIVQQSDQSVDETDPEDAKFLSIKNQNVEKETKAALNGKFNNASNTPKGQASQGNPGAQAQAPSPKPQKSSPPQKSTRQAQQQTQPQQQQPTQQRPPTKNFGLNGLSPSFNPTQALNRQFTPPPRPQKQNNAQAPQQPGQRVAKRQAASPGGDGISQTDDHLEDIALGTQTLLKTKEYKYYSFYARVREQLRSNWNPLIRQKVSFLYSTGRSRELASRPTKKTSLRVTLNEDGYLESIELLKTSGITSIDRAAIDAFRAAAPFPNPPDGMKEKDDKVRLFWDFVLET